MMTTAIKQELIDALIENPYDSLILIDDQGIVQHMSQITDGSYLFPPEESVGRHILEVSPQSKLPRVLETGKAEFGARMMLNSEERVVARIPLYKDGKIIGAAGKLISLTPGKLKTMYDRINNLDRRLNYYKQEQSQAYGSYYGFNNISGKSKPIRQAIELGKKAAMSQSRVLILGESGTGKELFAHAIHEASQRCDQSFVSVNCASIPNELFESEFFGYEPGAFTGANKKGKVGKFEVAHGGTIFLDEIGEMPLNLQIKLLRVLQEKEIEPIGASKTKKVDFRLISATNQNIEDLVDEKQFRLDLYYRINVVTIKLPPLREIITDVPLLVEKFLEDFKRKGAVYRLSDEAMVSLMEYDWPGNVRELKNVIERATIVCKDFHIQSSDLPLDSHRKTPHILSEGKTIDQFPNLKSYLAGAEKQAIIDALEITGNNKVKTARMLGIHRTGLYQKIKKFNIS